MRKIGLLIVLAAYVLMCRTSDSVFFSSRRMLYQKTEGNQSCLLVLDYPVFNNALGNSIRTYLDKQLGGTFRGSRSQSDSLTMFYGDRELAELKANVENNNLSIPADTCFFKDIRMMRTAENNEYVYYTLRECTNAVLGDYHVNRYNVCFRKKDGRMVNMKVNGKINGV